MRKLACLLALILLTMTARPQAMSGTYTIGASPADFADFSAAATALNTYGIAGPVTFYADSGHYTGQVALSPVVGSSPSNTITFVGDTLDSTKVVLSLPSSSSGLNNYLLRVQASYVNFRSLTFERTGSQQWGIVLDLSNALHIDFSSCLIRGVTSTTTSSYQVLAYGYMTTGTQYGHMSFNRCRFLDGSYGLRFLGPGTFSRAVGITAGDCVFERQYGGGIWISYFEPPLDIKRNTFSSGSTYSLFTALHLDNCAKAYRVEANRIDLRRGTGIRLNLSSSFDITPALAANNLVYCDTTVNTALRGIVLENSGDVKVYYNSVHLFNGHSGSRCLDMVGLGTFYIDALNNNLSTDAGQAMWFDTLLLGNGNLVDYNNLHSSGSTLATIAGFGSYTDLQSLQSASGTNIHSLSVPVLFMDDPLRHNTPALDGAGTASLSSQLPYTIDIDGETRSPVSPDIGADEYGHYDIRVDALIFDSLRCTDHPDTLWIRFSNLGSGPFTGLRDMAVELDQQWFPWNPPAFPDTLPGGGSVLLPWDSLLSYPSPGSHSIRVAWDMAFNPGGPDTSAVSTLQVQGPPAMSLGSDTAICPNHIITLAPDTLYDSYLWSNGQTTPSITFLGSMLGMGTHTIWLDVTSDDCTATDTLLLQVISCAGDAEYDYAKPRVYPVPATDAIHVELPGKARGTTNIRLSDASGMIIQNLSYHDQNTIRMDISHLGPGYYHLSVDHSGLVYFYPFIKL